LLKNQAQLLRTHAEALEDEELKAELLKILDKYIPSEVTEGVLEPTLENIGNSLLSMVPEDQLIQQRSVARPEFAFDNGELFSLDMPEGAILSSYDMEQF